MIFPIILYNINFKQFSNTNIWATDKITDFYALRELAYHCSN